MPEPASADRGPGDEEYVAQGLQVATTGSEAITARRKHSAPPRAMKRCICNAQPSMGIRWLRDRKLASMLGTMTNI